MKNKRLFLCNEYKNIKLLGFASNFMTEMFLKDVNKLQ